jgi:hypothetical protein
LFSFKRTRGAEEEAEEAPTTSPPFAAAATLCAHGSGVITRFSFTSHFAHTIFFPLCSFFFPGKVRISLFFHIRKKAH